MKDKVSAFLVKEWYRLVYILFCAVGIIMSFVLLAMIPNGMSLSFTGVCYALAPMMFFIGTIVYNVLKLFEKTDTHANWSLLGFAAVVIAMFAIGAEAVYKQYGLADFVMGTASTPESVWYSQLLVSIAYMSQLIVFGLMPFIKGISKVFIHEGKIAAHADAVKKAQAAEKARAEAEAAAAVKTRKPRTPKPAAPANESEHHN